MPEPVPQDVAILRSKSIPALAGRLAGMKGPAAAVTLGDAIVLHPDVQLTTELLRHELEHVKQWRRHSLSFPFLYVWGHFRHGYRNNPFEVEARAAEQRSPESGGAV